MRGLGKPVKLQYWSILLIHRYIIECSNCGIIYQSRQHWYGNSVPEHGSIIMENKHLWSSSAPANEGATVAGSSNRYREAIDMLRTVSDNVSSLTGSSTERIADTVAPQYWIPNADIKVRELLKIMFILASTKSQSFFC